MASFPTQVDQRNRLTAIIAIAGMHIGALYFWPGPVRTDDARRRETAVTFVALAPKPVVRPSAAARHAVRERPSRKAQSPPVLAEPTPMTVVPSVPAAPPDEANIAVARSHDDIVDQAKLDVGKIDKELRKQRLDPGQRNTEFGPTRRERLIAGAMRHRGPLEQVETILPDGRRMSRVGNNCAVMESNGLVGARDVFKDGVKTKWSRCNN